MERRQNYDRCTPRRQTEKLAFPASNPLTAMTLIISSTQEITSERLLRTWKRNMALIIRTVDEDTWFLLQFSPK